MLIFTSKTGGGHISLAEALRDRLQDRFTIEMIDPQPGIIHLHYRLVSRYLMWLWAAEFKMSDQPARSLIAHKAYNTIFGRAVGRVLRTAQPDLAMTTFPFLTYEVVSAMYKVGRRVPFVMQLADPNGVHVSWLTEHRADAVFAPTRETHAQTLAAGFPPERVHLTGWPVREQFFHTSPDQRTATLEHLGLHPDRFTVFLQGGGEGAAKFMQTVENVLAVEGVQIILAAGTNRALLERFHHTDHLYALPFTRDIAPYMAAADVVMGKAGPNMLFEAVTLGKPFIPTSYIPGQEEVNLEFIERHQLGWIALDARSQTALVEALATDSNKLKEMDETVNSYREWNSAATKSILPLVEGLLAITL